MQGISTINITIPGNVIVGNSTIMRVVMQETSTYSDITPCGSYPTGETQDYRIVIATPGIDVGVTALVAPSEGYCQAGDQYATVRIRNFGTTNVSNVPVSAVVKQGATTIANLSGVFSGTIAAGSDMEYTFQTSFALAANTAYTVTANTTLSTDQSSVNDQVITNFTSAANPAPPTGTAVNCGTNGILSVTSSSSPGDLFNWYNSATATVPIASGTNTTTTNIETTYYLSKNEVSGKVWTCQQISISFRWVQCVCR